MASVERAPPGESPNRIARAADGRLDLWTCSRCGYVYDGNTGESLTGTPLGTPFERLSDTWVCPHCAAEKAYFFC